jgi:hypothetical protein
MSRISIRQYKLQYCPFHFVRILIERFQTLKVPYKLECLGISGVQGSAQPSYQNKFFIIKFNNRSSDVLTRTAANTPAKLNPKSPLTPVEMAPPPLEGDPVLVGEGVPLDEPDFADEGEPELVLEVLERVPERGGG